MSFRTTHALEIEEQRIAQVLALRNCLVQTKYTSSFGLPCCLEHATTAVPWLHRKLAHQIAPIFNSIKFLLASQIMDLNPRTYHIDLLYLATVNRNHYKSEAT